MNRYLLTALLASGTLLASACSPNDSSDDDHGMQGRLMAENTSDNCDMQGMDMSKMSAEEHQKMTERCGQR